MLKPDKLFNKEYVVLGYDCTGGEGFLWGTRFSGSSGLLPNDRAAAIVGPSTGEESTGVVTRSVVKNKAINDIAARTASLFSVTASDAESKCVASDRAAAAARRPSRYRTRYHYPAGGLSSGSDGSGFSSWHDSWSDSSASSTDKKQCSRRKPEDTNLWATNIIKPSSEEDSRQLLDNFAKIVKNARDADFWRRYFELRCSKEPRVAASSAPPRNDHSPSPSRTGLFDGLSGDSW